MTPRAILGVLIAIAGCESSRREPVARDAIAAGGGDSNVRAADYIGPAACGACHPENHALWRDSLHSTMNQVASRAAIIGDFDNARIAYGGGEARFERDGDMFVVILQPAGGVARRFRVTRTIGTRYLQEYVGVDERGGTELRLPFGWWKRRPGWYPQPYFDSWFGAEREPTGALAFDPYTPDPSPWAGRCAWCHNTYPFELRAARGDDVGNGFERYVTVAPAAALAGGVLPVERMVSVGISCESCHLGGRGHAAAAATNPDDAPISFVPRGDGVAARPDAPDLSAGRDSPAVIDAICAQCHSTPSPRFADGAAARNSSEALAMAAGACASQIACTDCHDPHASGPGSGAAPETRSTVERGAPGTRSTVERGAPGTRSTVERGALDPIHVDACAGCHADLADADAARAHARHDATDVSCLDCHMPRITQGISAMVRSHRISSPGDPRMIATGAPDACILCHLDRSPAWLQRELAAYDVAIAVDPDTADLALGERWLRSTAAGIRITAAAAWARSPMKAAVLPDLIRLLDDPVAYYRMFSLFAVEDALGRRLTTAEYDPVAEPTVRRAQIERLLAALRARRGTPGSRATRSTRATPSR